MNEALRLFYQLRDVQGLKKKPSTSELIDWIKLLIMDGSEGQELENMDVFKKETFGPVFCITKIKDVDEAIRLANKSDYGLGGSLWTSNIDLAKRLVRLINTGAVFINDMTKSDPRLPFGGINKSGYGIELSKHGIREFVNMKTIVVK